MVHVVGGYLQWLGNRLQQVFIAIFSMSKDSTTSSYIWSIFKGNSSVESFTHNWVA